MGSAMWCVTYVETTVATSSEASRVILIEIMLVDWNAFLMCLLTLFDMCTSVWCRWLWNSGGLIVSAMS